eukprot:3500852-Rhodomonas_salina.5
MGDSCALSGTEEGDVGYRDRRFLCDVREMRQLLRGLPEERAWEVLWGLGSQQSLVGKIARTLGALALQGSIPPMVLRP